MGEVRRSVVNSDGLLDKIGVDKRITDGRGGLVFETGSIPDSHMGRLGTRGGPKKGPPDGSVKSRVSSDLEGPYLSGR